jgi:thymidine phosphorylase
VLLRAGDREAIATLHQVESDLVASDQAGLSEVAWERLGVQEGDLVYASHPKPVESLSSVRRRIYGNRIDESSLQAIMTDVVKGSYSDVHLSSFITACAAFPLDLDETIALTKAMVDVGETLTWSQSPVVDKHSVGGLPCDRSGARLDDAENLVARHYVACRHSRYHGDSGAGRPRFACYPPCRRKGVRLRRLGRRCAS